jgi:hypothetical protein
MTTNYDRVYTNFFNSLGIEPWITGFLKNIFFISTPTFRKANEWISSSVQIISTNRL